MNGSRFWMFFTLIFDLHNLQKQGNLRSVAHPQSPLRWELLPCVQDWESTLLNNQEKASSLQSLEDQMENHALKPITESEESLICTECGVSYKKPWTLKAHMLKKHGEKDKCTICNASFEEPGQLKKHMSVHSFSCNICDKILSDARSLQRHLKVHDKLFVCEECKEVFLEKNNLNEHVKTHLVCSVCQRTCENKQQLKRHFSTHK